MRLPAVAILVALLASGCAGNVQQTPLPPSAVASEPAGGSFAPSPSASATARVTATSAPTDAPSVAPTINGPAYDNPVFSADFPDPHVLLANGSYYAYSTNSANQAVPVISSPDLVQWTRERDGMPALPSWAMPNFGNTWAPGVMQVGDSFVLYFVARDAESDRQCIGAAVADNPIGPFRDQSDVAFICQSDLGGSIDPYPFVDSDGKLYLYWKNDGNCCAKPVGLWVQALSADGLRLTGKPVELIQKDQAWESPLIENPAMVENEGSYYLFYSGNWWESYEYAVGYALCETVTGPCKKPLDEPLYHWNMQALGPGGESFFKDAAGDLWMAYHAWSPPNVGYAQGGQRTLRIDPARFENGVPVITGPTADPQPLP